MSHKYPDGSEIPNFERKSFSLPSGPLRCSQERWDAIFAPKDNEPEEPVTDDMDEPE